MTEIHGRTLVHAASIVQRIMRPMPPLTSPIKPMLCKRTDKLPAGDDWLFEPKWDGFRALIFRDGDNVVLQSRDLKPMERYFPELLPPIVRSLPTQCIMDGEIVIVTEGALDFDAMLQRIHPAKSRVQALAESTPASLVLWDVLSLNDNDLMSTPFRRRREILTNALANARPPIHCTPATEDRDIAQDWFSRFEGAGFDGVIAKPLDAAYEPGKRTMLKVKHQRTADCVVGGFRWHKQGPGTMVGSLLLGLYDQHNVLHHIGVAASFKVKERSALVERLAPYRENAEIDHPWQGWLESDGDQRRPGAPSRWNRGKTQSWVPLRPDLVCEVSYDHMQGTRFRHTAHLKRWRPDKPPTECRYDQLDVTPPVELGQIFTS